MAERGVSLSPTKWFGPVIAIIALTNIAVLLDIPILRQLAGFLFLTFIPGLLIVRILKLNRIGLTTRIVLSVGLSVAFSMLFGLLVSSSSLALGYTRPLSTVPLLISFSIATFVLAIIAYIRNKGISFSLPKLKLTTREKAFLIVPALFPLLSILGMRLMNLTDNNVLLMLLLFLIPAYVIFVSIYRNRVPERVYPAAIFLIGISLLLMYSLRSNHIVIGTDTGAEFYFFRTTWHGLRWSVLGPSTLDACLSISLLPSIYQSFLNINQEYLFKLLYSLIFSISPLVIYILSKKHLGAFYGSLASLFFMAQIMFLHTPSVARVNTAALFCGLGIMVVFHDGISEFARRLLFIIFAASCIVSHYSTTYIFFFILLLTWIGMQIIPRIISLRRKPVLPANPLSAGDPLTSASQSLPKNQATALKPPHPRLKSYITISVVALFFVMLFFWYSQITIASFSAGVGVVRQSFLSLHNFFTLESRVDVPALLGATMPQAVIPSKIYFVVTWATFIFIAIGIITTLYKHRERVSLQGEGNLSQGFLTTRLEMEYLAMAIVCGLLLVVTIALPYVSYGYELTRVYLPAIIVLSPYFIIGAMTIGNFLKARRYYLIILVVLIPYFMCTTGALYQLFHVPGVITLNPGRGELIGCLIYDQDSYGAKWLQQYREKGKTVYGSGYIREVLGSQGAIPPSEVNGALVLACEENKEIDGYIYLGYPQVVHGKFVVYRPPQSTREVLDIGDLPNMSSMLNRRNKIYATNGSEVWR